MKNLKMVNYKKQREQNIENMEWNRNWILSANISFSFNGTKEEALEKLKEDMDFLEEEIFVRDSMEYMISDKIINKSKLIK
jgi:hypothetical protein